LSANFRDYRGYGAGLWNRSETAVLPAIRTIN